MLDRHNHVACAAANAIRMGNPETQIIEDKTVKALGEEFPEDLRGK
jgi:hypothetical protein